MSESGKLDMNAVTDISPIAKKRGFVRPVLVSNALFAQALADDTCTDSTMIQTLRAGLLIDALLESMRRSSPRLSPFIFRINDVEFGVVPVSLPEGIVLVECDLAKIADRGAAGA